MAVQDEQSCYDMNSDADSINLKNPMEQFLCGGKQKKIKKRQRVNSGSLNLIDIDEQSHCSVSTLTDNNSLFKSRGDKDSNSVYVLRRDSGSFQSRGYLFLAVVFGMMCYQSYSGQEKADVGPPQIPTVDVANKKLLTHTSHGSHNDLNNDNSGDNIDMHLGESDVSDQYIPESLLQDSQSHGRQEEAREQHQNVKLTAQQLAERMQGPFSQTLKNLASGKYQYLTYLMSSTACLYFWLAPNH